jgi:RNA polymerase sigma-70 factor, ECF subfamily
MALDRETLRPDELLAQLGWVRALARRLVADPDVTDDVLQQVCLLALEKAPSDARAGPRLRAWLATVTRNLARHAARSDGRRLRREQAAARPEALPSTADIVAHREALRRLVDAVTSLEEPYYSVVVARYLDGCPVAEIAARNGASSAAVRQQLSRARQQLRARLQALPADARRTWLPAALPLASVPAALQGAPAKLWLTRLGGFLMATSVPPLVAAVAVALVIAGAIVVSGSDERAAVSGPAVAHAPEGVPASAPVPGLSAHDRAKPALLEVSVADAGTPAERLALPHVPAVRAWDGLFKAADDLAYGTVTQEGLVNLAFDLLAQLPADATPEVVNGFAVYDLLASAGRGKVQLIVNLDASADSVANPLAPSAFTIKAELDTRPGAYTGNAADRATCTNVEIHVGTDARESLQGVSALSQNLVPGSQELWSQMSAAGSAVAIGGTFSIATDTVTWRPITVEASGSADKPGFLHTFGDPVEQAGGLGDPRTQLLNDVLAGRRRSVPR